MSGASNAVKTDVFFGEFGVGMLHNCAWTFIHLVLIALKGYMEIREGVRCFKCREN